MKTTRLVIMGLLIAALAGTAACSGKTSSGVKVSPVASGNMVVTVSGDGKTETLNDTSLTFGIAGRVDKLLVKEGDRVTAGQVIAALETDSLELALAQAEYSCTQAQVTLNQSELAVSQADVEVTHAEINKNNAEITLQQTTKSSSVSDIKIAQADVDTAKRNLDDSIIFLGAYTAGSPGYEEYQKNIVLAQARLKAAQDRLNAMLGGFGSNEVAVKEQQVLAATQSLAVAKQSLEQAKQAAELGKQSLALAGKSRDYAKRQLEKANITAPFAGIITSVPVDKGDTVAATTQIAQLIDPDRMELKIQVDEVDIPAVRTGQKAVIKVDAMPGENLSGTVIFVSPVSTKEGGVTMFDVKIELNENGGKLKSGMSASADIIVQEHTNVLLVPSQAVKRGSNGSTLVKVMNGGKLTDQAIEIGLANDSKTEVLSGLSEGTRVALQ
jgi:HlyD family secretion protein